MSTESTSATRSLRPSGGKIKTGVIIKIVILVIVLAAAFIWYQNNSLKGFSKDWQAVFLTNGQVYFGQVEKQNNAELLMKDIYYLQVTQPLQQAGEGEQPANTQGGLSLVKLGNELHGPLDAMHINREHVLFVEDLKDDSNVVTAISNYKSGQ